MIAGYITNRYSHPSSSLRSSPGDRDSSDCCRKCRRRTVWCDSWQFQFHAKNGDRKDDAIYMDVLPVFFFEIQMPKEDLETAFHEPY